MNRRRFICGLVLLAIAVAGAVIYHRSGTPLVRLYTRGGLNTVNQSALIQAYRVYGPDLRSLPEPQVTGEKIVDLDIIRGPIQLTGDQADRLRRLLNDPSTYGFGRVSACTFHPDVAFRFVDESGKEVVIVLCFHCDDLHLYIHGGHWTLDSFDRRRREMLLFARELFPDDAPLREFSLESLFGR